MNHKFFIFCLKIIIIAAAVHFSKCAIPAYDRSAFAAYNLNDTEKDITSFGRRCGTPDVVPEKAEQIQEKIEKLLKGSKSRRHRGNISQIEGFPAGGVVIPVAFHVIHNGSEGFLTDDIIYDQIDVMNAAYQSTGVQFDLQILEYTNNAAWFSMGIGTDATIEAKSSLSVDPNNYLNIYTAWIEDDILGFATFPWDLEEEPDMDGVVILYSSLPGGMIDLYNEGDTTVHEVGHWLGLYHTFQSSRLCVGRGDYVSDTPFERIAGSTCNEYRNTCLLRLGRDPIHNYMDYTPDACMYEFTPGQIDRAQAMTVNYRPGLLNPSMSTTTAPGGTATTTVSQYCANDPDGPIECLDLNNQKYWCCPNDYPVCGDYECLPDNAAGTTTAPSASTTTTSSVPGGSSTTTAPTFTTTTTAATQSRPIIDSFTVDPSSGEADWTLFTFACQAHDPDGTVVEYVWDLDGDGYIDFETTTGIMSDIYYYYPGTYTAQVQVYDNDNNASDIATVQVTVW